MNTQPVLTWAAIVAFLETIVVLLTSFGIDLSDGQQTAITAALVALGPIVAALLAWGKVTPLARPRDAEGNALVTP